MAEQKRFIRPLIFISTATLMGCRVRYFNPQFALHPDGGAIRRLTMKSMRRIGTVLRLSLLAVMVVARTSSTAQTRGLPWGDYRISEPKTYKNLTIFLIQGKDTLGASVPLTLEEALKQ